MKRMTVLALLLALVALAATSGYAGAANTLVVDDDGADCPDATYVTIQAAVSAASNSDTIAVCAGTYAGATVNKSLRITARGNAIINDGPNSHSFLRAGFLFPAGGSGSGTTISGFKFVGTIQAGYVDDGKLDFPVFSRGADNVTVEHNVMVDSLQGITNWHGSAWIIQHNRLEGLWTLCGGGIGIIIASWNGTPVTDNLIAHNTIEAAVSPDCDFYTTSGITVYSDTRGGDPGGPIYDNRIVQNRSRLTGTWESQPAADGFEITDGGLLVGGDPDVTGNIVAFNDFRGSSIQMYFAPSEAEGNNTVSRNLGSNRGGGITPASTLLR